MSGPGCRRYESPHPACHKSVAALCRQLAAEAHAPGFILARLAGAAAATPVLRWLLGDG